MQFKSIHVTSGRSSDIGAATDTEHDSEGCINVLLCERHSRVTVPSGMVGMWCPLTNGAWVDAMGSRFFVTRGRIYISDSEYSHEVCVPMRGLSIAIIAKQAVWRNLMSISAKESDLMPIVFPMIQDVPPAVRAALLRLVRIIIDGKQSLAPSSADSAGQLMAKVQHQLLPLFQRCPGSSIGRRSHIFIRLQRVRHLIHIGFSKGIDINTLATLANYSHSRLIRHFTRVFGESPYSCLLRTRIENAHELIRETDMNISDIWRMIGFENRASFARSFKRCSGGTASSFRSSYRDSR